MQLGEKLSPGKRVLHRPKSDLPETMADLSDPLKHTRLVQLTGEIETITKVGLPLTKEQRREFVKLRVVIERLKKSCEGRRDWLEQLEKLLSDLDPLLNQGETKQGIMKRLSAWWKRNFGEN